MKFTFASTLAATAAALNPNSTPIYGTYPGWVEGSGKAQIDLELFEDFLCSDCLAMNPTIEALMTTPW